MEANTEIPYTYTDKTHKIALDQGAHHYMHTKAWAETKASSGFGVIPFQFEQQTVYLYTRKVPGVGSMAYVPFGPNVFSAAFAKQLRQIAREHNLFMIRLEPAVASTELSKTDLAQHGFTPVNRHVQYLSTLVVDLDKPLAEVFMSYNSTARNEIRKSIRGGVVCRELPYTPETLDLCADIVGQTQARQQFWLRKETFLRQYWNAFAAAGQGRFFVAELDGKVLSVAFIIVDGAKAYYKDGGSVYDKATQSLAAPTLLQWYVAQALSVSGVKKYDLCGALANGVESADDPLWGVYKFKAKFTSQLVNYPGFIDLITRPTAYKLWQKTEKLYTKLHRKLTNDIWY